MQVDLWQLVYTLSDALDLVGVDDRYHGKRVAVMAATIGEELGWDRPALETVFFGGLLHDSGVSSTNPQAIDKRIRLVRGKCALRTWRDVVIGLSSSNASGSVGAQSPYSLGRIEPKEPA